MSQTLRSTEAVWRERFPLPPARTWHPVRPPEPQRRCSTLRPLTAATLARLHFLATAHFDLRRACMSVAVRRAALPSLSVRRSTSARWLSARARVLPDAFPALTTLADVTATAELLYTPTSLIPSTHPTVTHISSVYSAPATCAPTSPPHAAPPLLTLRVDGGSPRSAYDWFALNLSRARADLIVLTGAILRDEPLLTGNVLAEHRPLLDEWRRRVWGRERPVAVCVLTAGPVNFNHPLFADTDGDVFVYTTGQYFHTLQQALQQHGSSRAPLCSASSSQHITVPLRHLQALTATVPNPPATHRAHSSDKTIRLISPYTAPSLLSLLQLFRRSHPHIAVECGPSTTLPHYAQHAGRYIDTLLLSVYQGVLAGSVNERCVVPRRAMWEQLDLGASGQSDVPGFALTQEWLQQHYDCVSAARHNDWRFEWHCSKHRATHNHSRVSM